jgi:hypothetical protein
VNSQQLGKAGEQVVARMLSMQGFHHLYWPNDKSCDLLVEKTTRVEIKTARRGSGGTWRVNVHRHGRLQESGVDAYIFLLEDVPLTDGDPEPVYLVFPAPVRRSNYQFSLRSLLKKYHFNANNWTLLRIVCDQRLGN